VNTLPKPASSTPLTKALLVLGWRALNLLNDCSWLQSDGCMRGWPLIPMDIYIVRYYNVELGWYLHLMLKHTLGEALAPGRCSSLGWWVGWVGGWGARSATSAYSIEQQSGGSSTEPATPHPSSSHPQPQSQPHQAWGCRTRAPWTCTTSPPWA